ncbi:MAG: glucose-6-phosphate dehydrogenase [Candidatus Binatus sp.]|uniref:glucose-6-phosphate dehydrogenase n=1 Tax=Candidatus Binatus sp. TaxID=2811406 RepID=UPI00271997D7|nr:glucose-6-phosphate dehydrogenase [Candidatus Binatus sp.]MDO8434409.1 glucose-6-phosphate dehydrogenase [Candidatus Binatus sp.]
MESLTIHRTQPAPTCTVVIFGASGDLAKRKLIPALYNLVHCGQGAMPAKSAVLGFARRELSLDQFHASARDWTNRFSRLKVEEGCWQSFVDGLDYLAGLDQPDGFDKLKAKLESIEKARGILANRVYYLSIPPDAIRDSVARLKQAGLIADPKAKNFTRVVVEKPIGHDLESALAINRALLENLDESQIFRIDHYLGKETVQNLMVLRFANNIFERLWGARNVDHVQITVAEAEGLGTRAMYYDGAGALRDMVQNHILQTLSLLAMEPPVSLNASAIREAKLNVLQALRPIHADTARSHTVRARYSAGVENGKPVVGYMDEQNIPDNSDTETFVALKTYIDNWRWSGVPIYIRTGKRMPKRASSIFVQFKDVPQILFNREAAVPANLLTIRIQPDEGFSFDVMAKQPGLDITLRPVRMNLSYESTFGGGVSPDAYERLLLDVMDGDHTLFPSGHFVEKSWEFVQGILDSWTDASRVPLVEYPAGSWGPQAAEDLIRADGRAWHEP